MFDSNLEPLTPAQVIVLMLDEATRRTDNNPTGEFGIANGAIWTHKALTDRIDEYIERLIHESKGSLDA